MIEILYKPTFVRQYKKLEPALQEEVKDRIGLFASDPHHSFLKTHKLKGILKGKWSFSVNYSHRVVFQFENGQKTAVLLAVGDHEVYKN